MFVLCGVVALLVVNGRGPAAEGEVAEYPAPPLDPDRTPPEAVRQSWRDAGRRLPLAPAEYSDLTEDDRLQRLWSVLSDPEADAVAKEAAALRLAAYGGPEALARLWQLWQSGQLPASCTWLSDMVRGANGEGAAAAADTPPPSAQTVARAMARAVDASLPLAQRLEAIRQLAAAGTGDALAVLESLCLGTVEAGAALREEAFQGLLTAAPERALAVFGSLSAPSATTDPGLLVAMLEALGDEERAGAAAIALPLLTHPDSEVREEAAWVLLMNADEDPQTAAVLARLRAEEDAAVRSRLYGALGQPGDLAANASSLLDLVRNEEFPSVQIAGLQQLARLAASHPQSPAAQLFDTEAAPALADTAISDAGYSLRTGALIALKAARTPGARTALDRVAREAPDPRIANAAAAP
ncbi:MAG: hypothetical protein JXR77_08225 [Lentisphaeria bacterium]|nr:hypothetical protein [Lentisphaeria bacterium]